ncbi:MAG: glucans biosynthesis glucosyltransferase MdoH [Sphingomonadaceae bacterium]|nr:glucans biosynthesis glucosyltransferase MdoH [Sphingomonadaceae bacterium]
MASLVPFDGRSDASRRRRPDLPAEAPLAMPVQDLEEVPPPGNGTVAGGDWRMARRRILLVALTALFGFLGACEMANPFARGGVDLFDAGYFLLFFALFAWISFGFITAVIGFLDLIATGPGLPPMLATAKLPRSRSAVLVPVYNEEVEPLFVRLRAMTQSIQTVGGSALFDLFILSDSRAENEAGERFAFRRLQADSAMRVFYRRRPANTQRKPGNIAEWVTRFGGGYENMIVLDADSIMSGAIMARLATLMDQQPGVGLIQTVPALINGRTLFARWHQFAAAAYGPVASAGLRWWSGDEATFWGHNAIIRVRAFAESCGLPTLTGREPFGGHIMSHDMVEAALLRRRGWQCHMLPMPDGSYEEFPPTLIEHAVRDRRWAQGNIQHLRLILSAGFGWANRLQLLMGASAYFTSPLWLLLMLASWIEPIRASGAPDYVLLPSGWLLFTTIVLLFGPRVIALAWAGVDHDLRTALSGGRGLAMSLCVELPISILVAPVMMVTQTSAVIDILRGRPSGWSAQLRTANGLGFQAAAKRFRWHIALGCMFFAIAFSGVYGALWALPVALGLLLAPVTAMVTARSDIADWLTSHGIFVTEGRTAPRGETIPPACWKGLMAAPGSINLLNP